MTLGFLMLVSLVVSAGLTALGSYLSYLPPRWKLSDVAFKLAYFIDMPMIVANIPVPEAMLCHLISVPG
jgi:hypothetical protein